MELSDFVANAPSNDLVEYFKTLNPVIMKSVCIFGDNVYIEPELNMSFPTRNISPINIIPVDKKCKIDVGTIGVAIYSLRTLRWINGFCIITKVFENHYNTISFTNSFKLSTCYEIPKELFVPLDFEAVKEVVAKNISGLVGNNSEEEMEYVFDFLKKHIPQVKELISIPVCANCGKEITRDYETFEDEKYCHECFEKLFTTCSRCGSMVKKAEIFPVLNGNYICKKCNKREFICSYHRLYPLTKFYGNGTDMPYLGIELEVDEGGHDEDSAKMVVNKMNVGDDVFIWCSSDSSIIKGFEMITQPATLEYHCSIKEKYKNLFIALKKRGYLSHDTNTCGFHVHINRNFFGNEGEQDIAIQRLLYLTNKFWREIVVFSRRNNYKIEKYSKKPSEYTISTYMRKFNKRGDHRGHYYAINVTNNDTIEFRIFRGTLNINTFIATLQFVNACVLTAKHKSIEEIDKMSFENLCTDRTCRKYWAVMKHRIDTEE